MLRLGLEALINLQHRGALAADARTGDGAGLLTPLPRRLFAREAERLTGRRPDPESLAAGIFFFPPEAAEASTALVESSLAAHDLNLLAWREVPIHPEVLGERALATLPRILQAIVPRPAKVGAEEFEHRLYLARKRFERAAGQQVYVPSFSSRTIVYKGLLLAPQLPAFYADLRDPDYEVPLAVFHQRYSTNTLPTWRNAQPFRVLGHNGEINTLQGNLAWTRTREPLLSADFCDDPAALRPVADTEGSDSAMLDNSVELLMMGGREIRHAITMLVPPAWEKMPDLPEPVRDFYAYHACLTEPWDGPAALVFTDGRTAGAALDRNGLRPCRYLVTEDGLVAAASEAGAVPVEDERVLVRGRLGPGQMLAVDTRRGTVLEDGEIKAELAARKPYGLWVRGNARRLEVGGQKSEGDAWGVERGAWSDSPHTPRSTPHESRHPSLATGHPSPITDHRSLVSLQSAFGYTSEELAVVIKPMVEDGREAIGSMGDDTPLAVLSEKPRPLFGYFRQRFAEVTNPPIDPLREQLVMSLRVRLGARGNILAETPAQARLVELESPILTDEALAALRADPELPTVTLSTLFPAAEGVAGMERALTRLCADAETAVRGGAQLVVLSDRGLEADRAFIPSLLALGAVHNHLLRADLRVLADLAVESGEPREVHHFAALVGYGAAAVNPYLALATAAAIGGGNGQQGARVSPQAIRNPQSAIRNYLRAVEHGLFKVMSKMGISTVDAYCGAQIFEIIGLAREVVEAYFAGTAAHLQGVGLETICAAVLHWHRSAFGGQADRPSLDAPGFYKFKRGGEPHAFSPAAVQALHEAVKGPGRLNGHRTQSYAAYKRYSQLQRSRPAVDVRDLLEFNSRAEPANPESVEPAGSIVRRFSTAAMSHGSLSAEAHATLATAMNRLGGLSNGGEGGEDEARYRSESNSRVKQVASARFGVTPAYLVSADELQIKIAQGSKPGEGGQLPGHKVTAEIAAIRHATPGITLISPPPHHDIYSIEDLAQLIYDLRQINPRAVISVKLVAQAGVGTVATGVAKAGADVILISGSSGGTGASPLSSIKYAGVPWEIGLAEAQYMLVANGLRGRVRLRADGGLRTGRDVVIAALLGADEFSFGTAALIAEGCAMARACHLNTCPTGIATQRPELRAKFDGTPEQIIAFMTFVAEDVREILASLGLRSIDEAIGRVELLKPLDRDAGAAGRTALDLGRLLLVPPGDGPRRYAGEPNPVASESPLNERLIADCGLQIADCHRPSAIGHRPLSYSISNRDRTFGARLAGEIAGRHGDAGLAEGTIEVALTGSAGQSFGAFGVPGMSLSLCGEANDYVGKGLGGGRIVIYPPHPFPPLPVGEAPGVRETPVLAGNTVLYGATGGEVFIAGRAGERFAVRNSGAFAVVEGLGDHGCEYMTGGQVIVLGPIGCNFAAGMTGGVAYVWDEDGRAMSRVNPQLVEWERPAPSEMEALREWVARHARLTGSLRAHALLRRWHEASGRFWRVSPKDQPAEAQPIPVAIPAAEPAHVMTG